ncbi:MAG: hypothetical protein IJM97_02380, partial [Clostridia bacterium]|nr:hypothetical protein [Clostridia bacterium]
MLSKILSLVLSVIMLFSSAPVDPLTAGEISNLIDGIGQKISDSVDGFVESLGQKAEDKTSENKNINTEADTNNVSDTLALPDFSNQEEFEVTEQASGNWTDYRSAAVTESNGVFNIGTAAQLAWVAWQSTQGTNNTTYGFSGKTIRLTANIDLSAHYWIPIGGLNSSLAYRTSYTFDGNFDGNGYTISGLTVQGNSSFRSYGLFGYADGGTFQNVGLKNVSVTGGYSTTSATYGTGALIGYGNGVTVKNCFVRSGTVANPTASAASYYVGGLIGTCGSTATKVSHCYVQGVTVTNAKSNTNTTTGGLIGYMNNSSAEIKYSYFVGTLNCSNTTSGKFRGGVIGRC